MSELSISFCLLPQVPLYTQAPENQKFSVLGDLLNDETVIV